VDPDDVEMLQDLIIAAVNECVDKLEAKRAEILGPLAGGLKLPGL
jgi:DNA-binding protein YbaB